MEMKSKNKAVNMPVILSFALLIATIVAVYLVYQYSRYNDISTAALLLSVVLGLAGIGVSFAGIFNRKAWWIGVFQIIIIVVFGAIILYLASYVQTPQIYGMTLEQGENNGSMVTYMARVQTNVTVSKVLLQENGLPIAELSYYEVSGDKRIFTKEIAVDPTILEHTIKAYILLLTNEQLETNIAETITFDVSEQAPVSDQGNQPEQEPPLTQNASTGQNPISDQSDSSRQNNSQEQDPPLKVTPTERPSVSTTWTIIPYSLTDIDAVFTATTSEEASKVTLSCTSSEKKYGTWDMKTTDSMHWTYNADFYEDGTYTITIAAYFANEETATDVLTVTYPF